MSHSRDESYDIVVRTRKKNEIKIKGRWVWRRKELLSSWRITI